MIVTTLTILLVAVMVGMQVVQGNGTPSGGGTHTRSGGRVVVVGVVAVIAVSSIHRIRRHRVGEPCIDLIPDLRTVRILTVTITGIRLMEIDE